MGKEKSNLVSRKMFYTVERPERFGQCLAVKFPGKAGSKLGREGGGNKGGK